VDGVNVFSGQVDMPAPGVRSGGLGHVRAFASRYNNVGSTMADAGQGPGWQIPGRPTMKSSEWSGADISFLDTTGNVQYMKSGSTPGTYDALFGNRNTLSRDTSTNVLTLRSSDGTATVFNAITSSTNPGQMQSSTSPGGSSTTLTGTFGANQIMEMLQSYTSGGTTYEESFLQTYDANALLQTLVRRKRTNGGTWENIERVTYTYYDGTTSFGSPRDLKRCVEETWVGGSVNNFTAPKNTYFRYYKWSMNPQPGFEHGMKYMVSPATWQKIVSDGKNPETIPDHELDQYADRYFEYEPTTRRVSLWRTNGGTRQMMLNYSGNLNGVPSPAPFNHWAVKSTLDRTDGLRQIFYSNSYGMVMLSVLQGANGLQKWCSFTRFDDAGRAIWQISPSAITGYDETKNDLLNYNSGTQTYQYVRDTSGLIQTMEYDTNTATENYVKYANLRKGQLGSDIRQSLTEYTTNTVGGTTRILLSRQTVYTDDSHAVPIETIYGYLFHSGTLQPSQITTTLPAVPTTQNGSGTSATTFQEFDILGNMTASIDERGLETGYTHDPFTGAVTQSVLDVGGQNLTSDFEIDSLGRTTQTLGPVHEAVIGTTPTNVRIASWTTYDDSTNTVTSASGYAVGTSPSYTYTLVNPVSITISNDGGNVLEQIQATRASTSGKLLPTDTFSQSSYVRWTTNQYEQCCRISSTRSYFLIPSTGVGTEGTNYNTTSFGYDQMLRRNQTTSPGGTINFTVFDDRNLVKAVYVGTNATGATENDPTGGGAAGNNMVIVTQNDYDNGQAGGDGNLTTTLAWVSSSVYRRTSMTYDFRNRQTSVTGEENAYSETTYDNLNRPTLRQTRDGSSSAVLLSKAQTDYDDRGRVYRTTTWAVNPSTGAIGNALVGDTWYDAGSNVIKSLPAGAELFSKTTFDILGRATAQYVGYNLSAPTYAEAQTVVNDTIMEQQTMTYNQIGTALSTVSKQRYHDAAASQLGALGDPSTSPKARVTYSASWIDGVGRIIASADYGTNGGSSFTRPSAIPTRSDTILVSSTTFNDDGEVFSTFDPKNTETRIEYDDAGRQTIQIENYVSGGTNADQNRTTWTTYAPDGPVKTLTASNSDTGNQQTIYFYGTTLSDSDIASSQLLRYVRYPDSDGTNGDYVSYSYNRQGQQTLVVDQRGCQHAYDYDGLGRQIHDRALSLGTSAVGASRRLSTVYNTRGMVDTVTTWDNPLVGFGTVLNQVQNVHNDFGQQTHSYQAHDGSVNTSTTPKVQYSYANGSANTIRMTGMTYPSGRGLTYSYGTANGINDASSRIESVINTSDSVNLGTYQYLGTSGFVNSASGQPGINWTLIGTGNDPNTGDIYWGLDRFGRVDNCLWKQSTTTLAQIEYGYDRASNRTWRKDGVLTGYDELYSYDGLYRLTDQKRGTLNGTQTAITSGTFEQQWGLDGTGNWKTFKQDDDGNGTWELNQTRTANKVNEITGITNSVGTAWATPVYDMAGNMIGIPNAPVTITGSTPAWVPMTEAQWNTLTEAQWSAMTENTGTTPQSLSARYDAWNRLVLITNGTQKVSEHVYDARGYRIRKDTYTSGTLTEARHYYYTPGWQCVEERIGASTNAERQFVWGLRYIDDLILRDRSTANNGTMNERRYAMQDGNWNTIAITDTAGAVTERYAYSAYGTPVFMTGAGVVQTSSAVGFETLYAGYRYDGATPQMYYVRNRFLLSMIGTWNRRDPLGYVDGMSLYQYCYSNVIVWNDPSGLQNITAPPMRHSPVRHRVNSNPVGTPGGGPTGQANGPQGGTPVGGHRNFTHTAGQITVAVWSRIIAKMIRIIRQSGCGLHWAEGRSTIATDRVATQVSMNPIQIGRDIQGQLTSGHRPNH
jgi:RHS repeat-associated protein